MGKAETKNKNVAMASRMKALGIQRKNTTCPVCHKTTGGPHAMMAHVAKCGGNYPHNESRLRRPGTMPRYPLAQSAREALESMPKPGDHTPLTIEQFDERKAENP